MQLAWVCHRKADERDVDFTGAKHVQVAGGPGALEANRDAWVELSETAERLVRKPAHRTRVHDRELVTVRRSGGGGALHDAVELADERNTLLHQHQSRGSQ